MLVDPYRPTIMEKSQYMEARYAYKNRDYSLAFQILLPLVDNGYPSACILLGEIYSKEVGTKDILKAESLYLRAKSDPYEAKNAYIKLGELYLQNDKLFDSEKSERIILEGCERHIPECYYQYAKFLAYFSKKPGAYGAALKSLKCGNIETYVLFGNLLSRKNKCLKNDGYDTNYQLAYDSYMMAIVANINAKEAKKGIARLVSRKLVKPSDFPQAMKYALELADEGDSEMELFASKVYSGGYYGYESDSCSAERYIERAMGHQNIDPDVIEFYVQLALKGDISKVKRNELYFLLENNHSNNSKNSAIPRLMAIMKYHGIATEKNESEARILFEESVEINNGYDNISKSYLAKMQIDGRVMNQNISEGLRTLNSMINDPELFEAQKNTAYYLMATRCIFGEGCDKDLKLASVLLKKTYSRNYPMNLLPVIYLSAICYMEANDVGYDDPTVIRILSKSINSNDPQAQEKYAEIYEEIDPLVSLKYYEKAVRCDSSSAQIKIDRLLIRYPNLLSNDKVLKNNHLESKILYLEKIAYTLNKTDYRKCYALIKKLKNS